MQMGDLPQTAGVDDPCRLVGTPGACLASGTQPSTLCIQKRPLDHLAWPAVYHRTLYFTISSLHSVQQICIRYNKLLFPVYMPAWMRYCFLKRYQVTSSILQCKTSLNNSWKGGEIWPLKTVKSCCLQDQYVWLNWHLMAWKYPIASKDAVINIF